MSEAIFVNQTVILAKVEATKGTDAIPTGAANAVLVSDVTFTPLEGDEVERNNIRPYFGDGGSAMVTQYAKLSFSVEAAGVAAAGDLPGYEPLLRAAGASVTVTAGTDVRFAQVSQGHESVTIYIAVGRNLQKMTAAMMNVKLTGDAKSLPKFQFEVTGTYQAATDAALPAVNYTKFQSPFGINKTNSTLALHGVAVAASAFSFDFGNTVIKRDLINVDTVEITGRKSTGSVTFDNTLVSEKNWVELARTSARGPLAFKHGPGATNVIELKAPNVQLGKPSFGESDGVQQITVPLRYVPLVGNDEWEIIVR
ncbi:MAG: hypothetical protein JO200_19140 [Comamonas sp.]|nr:hypothetical protein [Comamonas sp.]